MPGHALRGMLSAGLVLIVIETLARSKTGQVGSFFADANGLLQRAFSPGVPLIPDRRPGAAKPDDSGGVYHMTPAQLDAAVRGFGTAAAIQKAQQTPGNVFAQLENLPSSGAAGQVDWSAVANSLNH